MHKELKIENLEFPVDTAGTLDVARVSVAVVTTVVSAVTAVVVSAINHQKL